MRTAAYKVGVASDRRRRKNVPRHILCSISGENFSDIQNNPFRVLSAFLNQKGMINMGMISYVKQEIEVIRERDPAIKSNMEVFLYPSFKVILSYRVAHKLYLKKHYFWARWISQRAARKTGIEIHPGATIGKGLS